MSRVCGRSANRRRPARRRFPRPKSVIYIFLSGGLAQHESFDMKPDAPDTIRGEFKPIATRTPGIQICEHLPLLAERSDMWALVRSLAHPHPDHSAGHMLMLSGRSQLPPVSTARSPSRRLAVDGGRGQHGLRSRATTCRRPWCCRRC